jgi:hypothetical protein
MPLTIISLRGTRPTPWGENNLTAVWRNALAERTREVHPGGQIQINEGTTFDVEIIFLFLTRNAGGADLDNLAKPVLDTLFLSNNVQVEPAGVLFNVDDNRVSKLLLKKIAVQRDEDEGTEIIISW